MMSIDNTGKCKMSCLNINFNVVTRQKVGHKGKNYRGNVTKTTFNIIFYQRFQEVLNNSILNISKDIFTNIGLML